MQKLFNLNPKVIKEIHKRYIFALQKQNDENLMQLLFEVTDLEGKEISDM